MLTVKVVMASLPGVDTYSTLTIANQNNTLFGPVPTSVASVDFTDYRCLYVVNENASINSVINYLLIYSAIQPLSGTITIGLDPAGVGNGTSTGVATTIPTRSSPPAGVVFQNYTYPPDFLDTGVSLAPGQAIAVWLCRTIPAGSDFSAGDSSQLVFEIDFV